VADGSEHVTKAMLALEKAFLIGVEGVTEILLVRHADCYRDMTQAEDPPLSALGREQAQRLARRMEHVKPDAVYSSPYRRAIETARGIGDHVRVDERLVEMPLLITEDGTLEFQETAESAVKRMRGVMDDVVAEHQGKRVVLISHAASILACLTDALHLEPGNLRLFPYFTSISTIRVLGDRRMIGSLGDVAHLE